MGYVDIAGLRDTGGPDSSSPQANSCSGLHGELQKVGIMVILI
jgi:hypothetical protein